MNRTGELVNRLASDVLLVQGSVTTSAAQVQYANRCLKDHHQQARHIARVIPGSPTTGLRVLYAERQTRQGISAGMD